MTIASSNAGADLSTAPSGWRGDVARAMFAGNAIVLIALVLMMPIAMTLDVPVSTWVTNHHFSNDMKSVMGYVRAPGNFYFTIALAALIVLYKRERWGWAGVMLLSGALSSSVTAILKWVFGRNRPFRGHAPFDWHPFPSDPRNAFHVPNLSFPSGDTTLAFATAAIIAIAFPKWRWVAYCWAFAVGITRVLQGAHYPSDVAGGMVVGVSAAHMMYWICARCRQSAT